MSLRAKPRSDKQKLHIRYFERDEFHGFAMGRNRKGAYIRVHEKSKKKAKDKLRKLTSRSQGRKLDTVLNNIKVLMRGRLGYYGIAEMDTLMKQLNIPPKMNTVQLERSRCSVFRGILNNGTSGCEEEYECISGSNGSYREQEWQT